MSSPNLVRAASPLVEIGTPPIGAAWLEEYLDGEDLSKIVGQQWSWTEARKMMIDVADGLAVLHAEQIVHRDLSANNVRRTSSGIYKVLDPGFARHMLRSGLTVGGQPGTRGFMSPEHLNVYSGAPTPSSDVFMLGNLGFLALAAELPIPYRGDDAEYVSRLRVAARPKLDDLRAGLPASAHDIIDRCLHRQPARRFRNGAELSDALQSAA